MRKFKDDKYNGLFFQPINAEKINVDISKIHHMDIVENKNGDQLIYWRTQIPLFRIVTNDPSDYLSDEDLKLEFKQKATN